jgi:hypothetical protein
VTTTAAINTTAFVVAHNVAKDLNLAWIILAALLAAVLLSLLLYLLWRYCWNRLVRCCTTPRQWCKR